MILKSSRRAITVARMVYFIVSLLSGVVLAYLADQSSDFAWLGLLFGAGVGGFFIYVESLSRSFTIRGFSTATFGLCIGFFCAWLLSSVKLPDLLMNAFSANEAGSKLKFDVENIRYGFNIVLYSALGYIGTALALRAKQDDFAVVIPFIRFRQENNKGRPVVCSLDVLVDGRLPALVHSGFINKQVILPNFAVEELNDLVNSSDTSENLRGKRGLATLEKLQTSPDAEVSLHTFDSIATDENHDSLTLLTCKQLNTRLLTLNNELTQLAKLQEIPVLNIRHLADAMKPQLEVGQNLTLPLVKEGKEEHQGVGYLQDGTMIVVNNAVDLIGSTRDVVVLSTIQTSAGLMVFAELENVA